jgi:hypothetical protein
MGGQVGGYLQALNAQAGGIQVAEITLNQSDLLTLRANPKPLLPAVLPGLIYIPTLVDFTYIFRTVAYAAIAGNIQLQTPAGSVFSSCAIVGSVDQVVNTKKVNIQPPFAGLAPTSNFANQPVIVKNSGAAEMTLGDGLMMISMFYVLMPG